MRAMKKKKETEEHACTAFVFSWPTICRRNGEEDGEERKKLDFYSVKNKDEA